MKRLITLILVVVFLKGDSQELLGNWQVESDGIEVVNVENIQILETNNSISREVICSETSVVVDGYINPSPPVGTKLP